MTKFICGGDGSVHTNHVTQTAVNMAYLCSVPGGGLTHLSDSHTEARDAPEGIVAGQVEGVRSTPVAELTLNIGLHTQVKHDYDTGHNSGQFVSKRLLPRWQDN